MPKSDKKIATTNKQQTNKQQTTIFSAKNEYLSIFETNFTKFEGKVRFGHFFFTLLTAKLFPLKRVLNKKGFKKYSNNCGAKKLHSNLSLFRAFLLKKGKILNNGKTQIDQFTHEGSILEQKIKDIRVVQN